MNTTAEHSTRQAKIDWLIANPMAWANWRGGNSTVDPRFKTIIDAMRRDDLIAPSTYWRDINLSGLIDDAQTQMLAGEPVPIISLWRPWANWVALEWKTCETRLHDRFKGLSGKRIGIHSSIKYDPDAMDAARPYLSSEQIVRTHQFLNVGGAVICTALVKDVRWCLPQDARRALIECDTRRFGLFLSDVKIIESIPMTGRQGIWKAKLPVGAH